MRCDRNDLPLFDVFLVDPMAPADHNIELGDLP